MMLGGTCLGIDVSGSDIKAVELRRSGKKYQVVQAARLKVGSDIGATVTSFIEETHSRCSRIVLSLPTNTCSVKFAALPKTNPSETAKMAHYEAETQIPLPLSDLIWGYSGQKSVRGQEQNNIIISAVQQSIAQDAAALMESHGLPLSAMVVCSLAEVYGLRGYLGSLERCVLLMDIGEEWTDITIVEHGRATSCRSLRIGTETLARALAEDTGVSPEEARRTISQRYMLEDRLLATDQDTGAAVQQWFDSLCMEVRRSAMASTPGVDEPLKNVILVGEGAVVPGLATVISERTNLIVEIADPWSGLSLTTAVTHNKQDAPPAFAAATGLAMAGLGHSGLVNLMPTDRGNRLTKRRKAAALSMSLGIAAVLLLVVLLVGNSSLRVRTAELQDLHRLVRDARKHPVSIDPNLHTITQTINKILEEAGSDDNSAIQILLQVSQSLPTSCWLSEVQFESGKSVVLRGRALSNSSIADLVYMLSSAPGFTAVSLDYSNLGRSQGRTAYDFQIRCMVPANQVLVDLSKNKVSKERLVVR